MMEWIVSAALLFGGFFVLVGSLGLLRFPDFFSRLHAPTKATTLGIGAMLVASMLYSAFLQDSPSLHEVLIVLFLFLSAPVSVHLMAKAALHLEGHAAPTRKGRP
jgi:multicomponent K+:H+ antiporter subunit G